MLADRLYSIPEARSGECLVATEPDRGSPPEEVMPMVESKENEKRTLLARISEHHVLIVVVLSVIHILLACGHSRDSGRADPLPLTA